MRGAVADQAKGARTYELTMHAGHLLIVADARRYLIDTGSPTSLGEIPIRLMGREFAVQPSCLGVTSLAAISDMVGTRFDALVGTDVLGEFDVEMDVSAGTLSLSDDAMDLTAGAAVDSIAGVPLVASVVAGRPLHCFLDSGAPLSYLRSDLLVGARALGEVEDFHPVLGRFRTETYATSIRCLGVETTLRMGRMSVLLEAALGMAGAGGILGTELLEKGVFRLSQRQGRASFISSGTRS